MNSFHILNGDCLYDNLATTGVGGEFIVFREALVDGPVNAETIKQFFALREEFLKEIHGLRQNEYYRKSIQEIEKIISLSRDEHVYLWFEDDLFCQVNMWFVLSLLQNHTSENIFRVFPEIPQGEDTWKGFGISTSGMLVTALTNAVKFSESDLMLGKLLWDAYRKNDLNTLKELGVKAGNCFRELPLAITAHAERFSNPGRPEQSMKEIIASGKISFADAFTEFSKREGVYGFGDVQVKRIFETLHGN